MDRGKQCNKVKSVGREGEGFCCYSTKFSCWGTKYHTVVTNSQTSTMGEFLHTITKTNSNLLNGLKFRKDTVNTLQY